MEAEFHQIAQPHHLENKIKKKKNPQELVGDRKASDLDKAQNPCQIF